MGLFGKKKKDLPAPAPPSPRPLLVLDDPKTKHRVELWPNKITLSRRGVGNALNVGITGDKEIYLNSITGIQLLAPGKSEGYIQFLTQGSQDNKGGYSGARTDENSIRFKGEQNYNIALKMKNAIEEAVTGAPSTRSQPVATVAQAPSAADELAKLATLRKEGVLSEKEFKEAKSRILGSKR